jgi:hypothetical protein
MNPQTGLQNPDHVVARLREASAIPNVHFDTPAVVASAQRALRRRRRRQAIGGVVGAGLVAMTLAGPVHLAGVGTFTVPGGHQVRSWLGVVDPDTPAPAAGFDLSELLGHFVTRPPSAEQMATDVANLGAYVLPVLEELQPTWYEDGPCDILEYRRGTFSVDGVCGGRPGEQPFDDAARHDLDRILDAVERSGVHTDELMRAEYAPDGTVESAGFLLSDASIEWNWAYLYSPDTTPPEYQTRLGPVTVTAIGDTGWWFEQAPDD